MSRHQAAQAIDRKADIYCYSNYTNMAQDVDDRLQNQLQQALKADEPAEKDFHIRHALQLWISKHS